MYGYDPKQDPEPGSWREILAMVGAVFGAMAGPLLAIVLVLGLVLASVFLLFTNVLYALVPLAILAGIAVYFVRRDRQQIREAEDALPPPYQ